MSQATPISSYKDYLEYVRRPAHQETMEAYPRFQYSVFVGEGREEQIVVRTDSLEELEKLKAAVAPLVGKQPSAGKAVKGNRVAKAKNFQCEVCGGTAEYREGVSKKTKKPYRGVFCASKDCDYARFW